MKKILFIALCACMLVQAQGLQEMTWVDGVVIKSIVDEPGSKFVVAKDFTVLAEGTRKTEALVRECTIKNTGMATAQLRIGMEIRDTSKHQSYFVSVSFYDKDKNFLLGHSFCSDYGQSLAGVQKDMQATEAAVDYLGGGVYLLSGVADLFVHQAMLYQDSAGGIHPIKYCSVRVFHLLAG